MKKKTTNNNVKGMQIVCDLASLFFYHFNLSVDITYVTIVDFIPKIMYGT